jgi:DtxR family Mn-dependent transcriptional regulator
MVLGEMVTQQTASMEDYLEAVVVLGGEKKVVRVTQLSKALGVKKPSVTSALKKLSQRGLVEHEKYGQVVLTDEGERIARDVFRRHEVLRHFLADILNVDPEVASEDACKMEHSLSPASLERLAKFVEFVSTRPEGKPEWLKVFSYYFEHGELPPGYVARGSREE